MVEVLQPVSCGVAAVDHFEISEEESKFSMIRREYVYPGKYARLRIHGSLVMTDTDMEQRTSARFVRMATGDVLVAGLGLGMILLPAARKENVRSILVVEKYQDVIDSVLPQIKSFLKPEEAAKIAVVCEDILIWKAPKGFKFDCIYFDIWPNICTENLKQIAKLHCRFKGRLKGDRFMDSWARDILKAKRGQESKERGRRRFYL